MTKLMILFFTKITFFTPLDKPSIPKEPTPENKSRIFELIRSILNLEEKNRFLKIEAEEHTAISA